MREVSLREKILCQRLFGANLPGGINPIKHEVPGESTIPHSSAHFSTFAADSRWR